MDKVESITPPRLWCVRADGGYFTEHFLRGGYIGIGWPEIDQNLGAVRSRDDLYPIVRESYPDQHSAVVIGNYVGQIARFLLEIKAGDYILTPASDTEWLHYGKVESGSSYYRDDCADGCRYTHRRPVAWSEDRLRRSDLSVPFQNTIRSLLSVFSISHAEEFFATIGVGVPWPRTSTQRYDSYKVVLEQILELDYKEFEILIGHLLTALGFEGSEVTGKPGDGGVDATGELNVFNLAKVKVFVQAKRYKLGSKVSTNVVRQLRQAIPFGGQGAFITTADFQKGASEVALAPGFPRIGLINGRRLVDLLIEHWHDIPEEFQELLALKPGLVKA